MTHVNGREATYCPRCSHPQGAWAVYVPNDEKAEHEAYHAGLDAAEARLAAARELGEKEGWEFA